jgi:divalent metal cation (Fe/Co/Zn/Cd) transporter
MEELHRVLAADSRILQIDEIATMHLGPQVILMALTLRFRSELSIPALDDAIREITSTLQSADKRVAYVYVRPGPNEGARAEVNPRNIRDIAFRAD